MRRGWAHGEAFNALPLKLLMCPWSDSTEQDPELQQFSCTVNILLLSSSAGFRPPLRSKVSGWRCTCINSFSKHIITEFLCPFLPRPGVQDLYSQTITPPYPTAGGQREPWHCNRERLEGGCRPAHHKVKDVKLCTTSKSVSQKKLLHQLWSTSAFPMPGLSPSMRLFDSLSCYPDICN